MIKQVLAGLQLYGTATRQPPPPRKPVIAQHDRASVLDYGGTGRCVLFVPSLINPPHVLDLTEDKSLLRWLARSGDVRPLLLDWGDPRDCGIAVDQGLSVAGHVETLLLPLMDKVAAQLDQRLTLAGYCLGGTMALAAAAQRPVDGLALIATPWDFDAYSDPARAQLGQLWMQGRASAAALGVFPMDLLQPAFWQLDPERSLAKYARFGLQDPDTPEAAAFIALEDWVNNGPPLTIAAAQELLRDFMANNVTGAGRWHVGGKTIEPTALPCPVLNILSSSDRIVPAAAAPGIGDRRTLDQGHVGMVVGSAAETGLWSILARWLSQLQ